MNFFAIKVFVKIFLLAILYNLSCFKGFGSAAAPTSAVGGLFGAATAPTQATGTLFGLQQPSAGTGSGCCVVNFYLTVYVKFYYKNHYDICIL